MKRLIQRLEPRQPSPARYLELLTLQNFALLFSTYGSQSCESQHFLHRTPKPLSRHRSGIRSLYCTLIWTCDVGRAYNNGITALPPRILIQLNFFGIPLTQNCGDPNLFNQFETFLRAATFLNLSSFQKHLFSIIRTVSKLSKTDRSNRQIGNEAFTRWGGRDRNPTEVFRRRLPLYSVTVGCLRQIRSGWQKTAKGENIRNGTVPTKCFQVRGRI